MSIKYNYWPYINGSVGQHAKYVMECNIFTIVQPFQFIAHVFEQKSIFLGIHF